MLTLPFDEAGSELACDDAWRAALEPSQSALLAAAAWSCHCRHCCHCCHHCHSCHFRNHRCCHCGLNCRFLGHPTARAIAFARAAQLLSFLAPTMRAAACCLISWSRILQGNLEARTTPEKGREGGEAAAQAAGEAAHSGMQRLCNCECREVMNLSNCQILLQTCIKVTFLSHCICASCGAFAAAAASASRQSVMAPQRFNIVETAASAQLQQQTC